MTVAVVVLVVVVVVVVPQDAVEQGGVWYSYGGGVFERPKAFLAALI